MFYDDAKTNLDKQVDLIGLIWNKYGTKPIRAVTFERRMLIIQRMKSFTYKDLRDGIRMLNKTKHLKNTSWFNFDFLIKNDSNLTKFLEGNYLRDFRQIDNQFSNGSVIKSERNKF